MGHMLSRANYLLKYSVIDCGHSIPRMRIRPLLVTDFSAARCFATALLASTCVHVILHRVIMHFLLGF